MNTPHATRLMRSVIQRLDLASFARNGLLWLITFGGLYGLVLLASRLLGIFPQLTRPEVLGVIPILACLTTLCLRRRPNTTDAARSIDRHGHTKDLFLTWSLIDDSTGSYQPLVAAQAEATAPSIDPQSVVPLRPDGRILGYAVAIVAGITLGTFLLPQFDPLGKVAAIEMQQQLTDNLKKERKATTTRLAQLKQGGTEEAPESKATQTVNQLKQTFRKMQPGETEKGANLKQLNLRQQTIGSQWRKLSEEKLATLLEQTMDNQEFGGDRTTKLNEWTDDLRRGDMKLVKQEINDLMDLTKRINEARDPTERAALARELKERLKDLERFASERAGSPEMAAAVRRAMRQMEASGQKEMTEEMLQDLAESLELSKLEMQQIAKAAEDLKKLEEALQTLQMAKQLNSEGNLDGEACANCQTLSDYAKLYSDMMGQGESGTGEGMRGPGIGEGGEAQEDDSVARDFKTERSSSAIDAGKTLLTIKTRGMGEEGDVRKAYRDQIGKVKQSLSEAILQEQVPPGYHESIRSYFDSMGNAADAPASP